MQLGRLRPKKARMKLASLISQLDFKQAHAYKPMENPPARQDPPLALAGGPEAGSAKQTKTPRARHGAAQVARKTGLSATLSHHRCCHRQPPTIYARLGLGTPSGPSSPPRERPALALSSAGQGQPRVRANKQRRDEKRAEGGAPGSGGSEAEGGEESGGCRAARAGAEALTALPSVPRLSPPPPPVRDPSVSASSPRTPF